MRPKKNTRRFSAEEVLSALSDSDVQSNSTDTSDEDDSEVDVVTLPPLENTFIKVRKVEPDPDQHVQISDCTPVLETLKPVRKSTLTKKDKLAPKNENPVNKNRNKRTVAVRPKKKPVAAKKKKVVTTSPGSPNPDSGLGETIISHPSTEDTIHPSSPASSDEFVTSTPISDDDSGESLSEILEAYNEYLSGESTEITHISETQMSPYETSSEDLSCSPVFHCKQVTHSSSSSGERFPEDLSPLSSSFPSSSEVVSDFSESSSNYIEWSESSDDYIQFKEEKVTSSRPNFTLAKIPFEQLCYFVKRYLKSVDKNPDKPEWPVHGMDKNQKRHFRRKVEDYKVQNDVLYHLHTYTETVNGETIKRCKYNIRKT